MIKITDSARNRMIDVLIEEKAAILRFGLQGGGCSGMSYYFAVEESKDDDDLVVSLGDDYILVVDPASNMYLEGAEIDFKKDLMGENFVFINPNSTGTCGCGSSVSF